MLEKLNESREFLIAELMEAAAEGETTQAATFAGSLTILDEWIQHEKQKEDMENES
ncbi:hypothetical protein [Alkalicoccobacillus gibsonii]|uniref:hypothetical protein n=1 Tax=Alkalicoccobacillus gibsonii TaxID=79881 RepID=UPI0035153814